MKIAVVGSREYPDMSEVRDTLDWLEEWCYEATILTGGARGVDTLVAQACRLPVEVIPADWKAHGKAAGPIRNAEIVRQADHVIAFWDGKSRGTKNVIDLALKQQKRLDVYFPTVRDAE